MKAVAFFLLLLSHVLHAQPASPLPFGARPGEKLTVTVHPGVELLAIIQYLAGSEGPSPSPYLTDVRRHFTPFRNHPAVLFLFNSNARFGFDLPELGWCFTDPLNPRAFTLPDSTYWLKTFSRAELTTYLKLCTDFARDSRFSAFYKQHQPAYARWGGAYRHRVDSLGLVNKLETFFRQPTTSRWYICLDPLNGSGAHAIMTKTLAPAFSPYIVYQQGYWSPQSSPLTDLAFEADIYNLVWHEGSHIYVNPLLNRYRAQIDSLSYLLPRSEALNRQNVTDWPHYVDESLVRAISLALHRTHLPAQAAQQLLREQKSGFIDTDALTGLILTDYVQTDRYPTFEAYFLVLLSKWASLKRAN
ncbi:MAG: DUF4932 domain-containing protein [Cytophagaceae bacterium]|nr:MAG: DUF4932 domain-containing protein [Cytophagaceae bacterium]